MGTDEEYEAIYQEYKKKYGSERGFTYCIKHDNPDLDRFVSDGFYAWDRSQALEELKEWLKKYLPKVKPENVRILQTHYSGLEDTDVRRYYFIFRVVEQDGNLDRPPCVECGSNKIISKGNMWYCKSCGRWFLKIKRKS